MASVTWSEMNPVHWPKHVSGQVACWSRFARSHDIGDENGLTGMIALVGLPVAFVASISLSQPLAFPLALATINLSLAGRRANASSRTAGAELALAILLLLVAAFFCVQAISGTARIVALAGIVLSLAFAALPVILRHIMAKHRDDGAVHCRDVEALDRLMPEERFVIVESDGRVAALSRAVKREFAASGLRPGADIFRLIDILDRPLLLSALDKAGHHEQAVSLRLNAEFCQNDQKAARINVSLKATDSQNIIMRLQETPSAAPDMGQPESSIRLAAPPIETIAASKACDLEDSIGFAIRLLAGDADRRGVSVSLKERPDRGTRPAPHVKCTARAARQIALNIIGNAIKFSHAGGKVTIETGGDDEFGLLCVRDEGVGIAERDRDALFTPHRRGGRGNRPGCGLGLAIVGDLIAGCGGSISIESELGNGTTVTVRIPSAGLTAEAGRADRLSLSNLSREIAKAA